MIKKILIYVTGEMSIKAIGFLMLPVYSHLISPNEYGILGVLNAMVAFLPFIFTFYYLYGYVRFSVQKQSVEMVSTFVAMGFVLNLFFIVISIGLYYTILRFHYPTEFMYFLFAITATASLFIFQILQMYHRAAQMAERYLRFSLLYAVLTTLLNITLLLWLKDKISAILLSGVFANIIVSIVAFIFMKELIDIKQISWQLSKKVLAYTIPLVPGAIALLLYSQADKLILFQYVSAPELGIYTMAFTLGLSMSYIGSALFMSYQPMFYAHASDNSSEKLTEGLKHTVFLLLGGLILVLMMIKVAYLLINERYASGEPYAMIIALAYSLLAFTQLLELHLTYIQRTSIVSFVYSIGGIFNVVLLYFLVQKLGGFGASLSLLLSACSMAILMYFLAQKHYYLPYNRLIIYFYFFVIAVLFGGIIANA